MHVGWGLGTLAGMLRFGAPVAAFAHVLGREERSSEATGDEDVYAPSLRGGDA